MQSVTSPIKEKYPLSERKILKKVLTGKVTILFLIYFVSMIFVNVAANSFTGVTWALFVVGVVILVLSYFYQRWYIAVYFYDMNDNFITIRKGPITTHEIVVPYERIQDVYVDQDLFDRFLGLYDVHLSTATVSSSVEAHIDGVEKEAAEGLRTMLLDAVHKKIGKKHA